MAYFEIPTSTVNTHYTQTMTLSGQTFTLELRYNSRMARWILSVLDAAQNIIVAGIPMLNNRSLTSQYTTLELPVGDLFCLNTSGGTDQPSLQSFLTTCQFFYLDPTT
jgi:hypothetical protein